VSPASLCVVCLKPSSRFGKSRKGQCILTRSSGTPTVAQDGLPGRQAALRSRAAVRAKRYLIRKATASKIAFKRKISF